MPRTSFSEFACSLARSLDIVGEWWTPLIVRDLYLGVDTFDDLVADLGISRSLLARRLSDLREAGVVVREAYSARGDRYRYRLDEAGLELVPIFATLTAWGDRWCAPDAGPPLRFQHEDHRCAPTVCCGSCGSALVADELVPVAGPGASATRGTAVVATRRLAQVRDADR